MTKSPAERRADFRARMKQAGFVSVTLILPAERVADAQKWALRLREQPNAKLPPLTKRTRKARP